jgi:16S rRNA (guanine1516-N2)-methyltransferase
VRWNPPDDPKDLRIECVDGRIELRGAGDAPGHGVSVDFSSVRRQGMRNTPLGRAIGDCKTVVDATAGLCGDAFLLALLGCRVIALERSPILGQLVQDGLLRAAKDLRIDKDALSRLRFVIGDARQELPALDQADAILLDPMFPAKRKPSALARKDIRLVGAAAAAAGESDQLELFQLARSRALRRVLVKRADDSPPLVASVQPDLSFSGRTSRIDVYLSRR